MHHQHFDKYIRYSRELWIIAPIFTSIRFYSFKLSSFSQNPLLRHWQVWPSVAAWNRRRHPLPSPQFDLFSLKPRQHVLIFQEDKLIKPLFDIFTFSIDVSETQSSWAYRALLHCFSLEISLSIYAVPFEQFDDSNNGVWFIRLLINARRARRWTYRWEARTVRYTSRDTRLDPSSTWHHTKGSRYTLVQWVFLT